MSFPKQELSSLHDDEEINPLAKQSSQTQASITKRPASPSERDIDHRESITSRKRSRKNNVRTTMHQNGSDGKPLTLIVGTLKENPAIDVFTKKKNLSSLANSSAIPALHFFVDADDFKQVHKMINTIAPNEIVFLPQYELGNAEKTRSHLVSLLSVDFMPRKDGGIGGRKETIGWSNSFLPSLNHTNSHRTHRGWCFRKGGIGRAQVNFKQATDHQT